MIIKKIFKGEFDEEIHSDFLKFGRGEFKDKYLIYGKRQKDKWAIKTSAEFANFFVRKGMEKAVDAGLEEVSVKGIIVSTFDLKDKVKFEVVKVKNFMGIKQLVLKTSVSPAEILDLMKQYPRVFFALSFKLEAYELKIKAKAPKGAKPSAKGGEVKADFCSLKTNDKAIIGELFFDVPYFNEVKIKHIIKVEDIIYPKDEQDPKMIREKSKRKGVLIRETEVDSKKSVKEVEFEV